ncbi:MAG TPA: tetratricopeptide repeat protein, partial [Kiritimatiellia bacterium]|nr:tetratricopeptide repeat protein [Kiritimatiellia bacterium]
QAVSVCEKWMRCGLIHSNALQNLSIAYENVGRFSEAAEMLGRRMEMWSICTPPEVERLAVLWLRAGDPLRARDALYYFRRRWVAADSRTVAELENLTGAANLAAGDPEEARKWFESALARNPELESARRNLAGLAGNAPGSAAERPAE